MVGYPAVSVLADLVSKDLADGDLKTWAEAGARSSVYREDLAEKFKGTRELDLITMHPYYQGEIWFRPRRLCSRIRIVGIGDGIRGLVYLPNRQEGR